MVASGREVQGTVSRQPVRGYRFDSFEVSTRTQVLLHKGNRIRIERLPLQLLFALLETPGNVVSRGDLCARLWSGQNFQQADKGLQVAAAKLREALGEQAADPRFIKTVHRMGYQFIGEVVPLLEPVAVSDLRTEIGNAEPAEAGQTILSAATRSLQEQPGWGQTLGLVAGVIRSVRGRRYLLLFGVTVAMLAAAAGLYLYLPHRPIASAGESIALGNISNLTNDAGLDGTLSTAMRIKFQESPYFAIVSDHGLFQQLKSLGGSNGLQNRLTACSNLHASLLTDGEIKPASDDTQAPAYQIVLNVWRCSDHRRLATESAAANSKTSVLPALDLVIDRLRKRLGESDASIERFDAPAAQITTTSLSALRAFNLGEENRNQGLQTDAISDFRLAIDLDPQFALAYARLSTVYYNRHERSLSQQYARRAFELREHTSERERLYIASHYYSFVTGEVAQAIQAYSLWITLYPHDPAPATDLAAEYLAIGYPQKALDLARRAADDEESKDGTAHSALMLSLLETGQYSSLKEFCQGPAHSNSQSTVFHFTCLRLAGVEHDEPRIQSEIDWAKANPGSAGVIEFAALIADDEGHLEQGNALFSEGRKIAHTDALLNFAAELDLDQADIDVNIGSVTEARSLALDALKLAPNEPYLLGSAAFVLARAGDVADAKAEADKAAAQASLDTILNDAFLPSVYAAIEMSQHNPKGALSLMEKTRPVDGNMFMELAPAYYRGIAFLADNHPDAAMREFRWVIDHRGLCPESIYVNLAMLRIGHAQQVSGHCDEARKQYATLDAFWKNADRDFSPLKELKSFESGCLISND